MDYDLHTVFSLVEHFRSLENLYIEVMLLTQIVKHIPCMVQNSIQQKENLYVMDKGVYNHGRVLGQN